MHRTLFRWLALISLLMAVVACAPAAIADAPTSTSAAAPRSPETETTLAGFEDLLLNAGISGHNFDLLTLAMHDPFRLGYWHQEAAPLPPGDAISALRESYLVSGAAVTVDRAADVSALMDGLDPIAFMPPDAGIVDILFSKGWGVDGKGEAVLYVSQESGGGRFYWYGVVIASGGFQAAQAASPTPDPLGGHGVITDYVTFQNSLLKSIVDRKYDEMLNVMGGEFSIGYWGSEGQIVSRDAMKEQLRSNFLPTANYITYDLDKDLTALLGGQPISSLISFQNGDSYAGGVYMEGWGADGKGQVVILIAVNSGYYYWWGMLYAPGGFH
jgi:hypothetical protein